VLLVGWLARQTDREEGQDGRDHVAARLDSGGDEPRLPVAMPVVSFSSTSAVAATIDATAVRFLPPISG
jgi:hypothetical protein